MEPVARYLNELLHAQRHGGRTIMRDECTLIVMDTPRWSERESRAVRAKFPHCDVAVESFDGSMSGFIVIITKHSEPWALASESAFLLLLLGVCYTLWWLHGYLQKYAAASPDI